MAVFTSLLVAVPPGFPPVANQLGLYDTLDLLGGTQTFGPTSVVLTGAFLRLSFTPTVGTTFNVNPLGPSGLIGGMTIEANAGTAGTPNFVAIATVTGLSVSAQGALQALIDGEVLSLGAQFWSGTDTFIGNAVNEVFLAGAGADSVSAAAGNDTVYAGADNDTVLGGAGGDLLHGEAGADSLSGEAGADMLYGGAGNDSLLGGADDDLLDGLTGNDRLDGGDGNDTLRAGAGGDTVLGGLGRDEMDGGHNSDRMDGGAGADTIFGDDPRNTAEQSFGNDTILGGTEGDLIFGQAGNDSLVGEAGGDVLFGGAGNDWLAGGLDADTLTGGSGGDRFIFRSLAEANGEVITDFSTASGDRIELTLIDANTASLANNQFTLVTTDPTAITGAAQILLTNANGGVQVQLFTDGVPGADASFFVARVSALSATDFFL